MNSYKKVFYTNENFRLDFRGDENFNANLLKKHCHLSFEIFLFYEGDVNYLIESNSIPLQPYTLLVLKPSVYHYSQLLSSKLYKRSVIHFDTCMLSPENYQKLLNTPNITAVSPNHPLVLFIESLHYLLDVLDDSGRLEISKYAPTHIANLITTMCTEELITDKVSLPIISKIVSYINNNLSEPLNLDDLASKMFFNKYYICHIFKLHMGISIMDYMRRKRLVFAQDLIEKGAKSKDAAEKAGFSNYTTFYRAYVKTFKKNPSQ